MSFLDNLQKAVSDGLEASKNLLSKAADKARELGEKGMLRWEIGQLNNQAEKISAKIGAHTYKELVENAKESISKDDGLEALLQELDDVKDKIEEKEAKLAAVGEEKPDSEEKTEKVEKKSEKN
jgi:predicted  nucleic acid-binding Zn-ribbon protein